MFNIEETNGVYYIHHVTETEKNISNITVSSKTITKNYNISEFDIVSMAKNCKYYLNKYAMFYFKSETDANDFVDNVLIPLELPNEFKKN